MDNVEKETGSDLQKYEGEISVVVEKAHGSEEQTTKEILTIPSEAKTESIGNEILEIETTKTHDDSELSVNNSSPVEKEMVEASIGDEKGELISEESIEQITEEATDAPMVPQTAETITEKPALEQPVDDGEVISGQSDAASHNEAVPTTSTIATSTENNSQLKGVSSGLSLLAQYDTDNEDANMISDESDTDSVVEVPVDGPGVNKDYRNQTVKVESSSSDSSDSDSDVECLSRMREKLDKIIKGKGDDAEDDDDDDDDEEGGGGRKRKPRPPKVKGELLLEDLPPIQDLHITVPEEECVELGRIHSVVDQLVLVNPLPNSLLIDLDTVLFLEKGKRVLGEVFDVLGQVADPLYCVRFNSNAQIHEKNINVGDVVYMAPKTQYTQFIILSSLMKIRGSDASWENDVEPPPRFLDYSDDEEERSARSQLRNKDRPNDHTDPTKRPRADDDEANIASTSGATTAPQRQYQNRGRGGRQNNAQRQRAPHYPSPHYQQNIYRPPNHDPSSWHSNYYPPPYYGGPLPHSGPYGMPPPMHHHANIMHYAPPTGPPPPMPPMPYGPGDRTWMPRPHRSMPRQHQSQPPPDPQMYVLNPYSVRPPVLNPPTETQSSHIKRENQ